MCQNLWNLGSMHSPELPLHNNCTLALTRKYALRSVPQGDYQKKKTGKRKLTGSMLALPIFPGSHPPSIVGADELNFCVRDGNRWTLIAINTNSYGWLFTIVYVKSASLLTPYMIAPFPAPVNSYFTAPVTRTIWSL